MSSVVYVAFCLECDAQLEDNEVQDHNCQEGKDNG